MKRERKQEALIIKDAAVGKGVFTLVQLGHKSYVHYNLPQGYLLFVVKVDDALAVKVNNFLADTLEREHGNCTREALAEMASAYGRRDTLTPPSRLRE
jgi:hypothetical protein